MKTISNEMPAAFVVGIVKDDGNCDIHFADLDTVVEETVTPETGDSYTQYVYEAYWLTLGYSENIATRIGGNYAVWLEEAKSQEMNKISGERLSAISATCTKTIYAGIDVTTAYGLEHFSLDIHDQQNLTAISMMIANGMTSYPYHADGKECVVYTAADLAAIVAASTHHIKYNTTYHNMLKTWINRETDVNVINTIVFGSVLPADLQTYMDELLAAETA